MTVKEKGGYRITGRNEGLVHEIQVLNLEKNYKSVKLGERGCDINVEKKMGGRRKEGIVCITQAQGSLSFYSGERGKRDQGKPREAISI